MSVDAARWTRIKSIVAGAMEREGDERARYVTHACGSDDALRREVERLLAADQGADSLLDAPAFPRGRPASETAGTEPILVSSFSSVREGRGESTGQNRESRWPTELVQRSAGRLGTLALLYAIGFLLAYSIFEFTIHFIGGSPYVQSGHTPGQVMMACSIGVALLVWATARRHARSASNILRVGLGFEVLGSLGIGLVSYSGPWPADTPVWGVSWICVWIMMFPLVIPAPSRLTAYAAFSSAAMGMVAIATWSLVRHAPLPPTGVIVASSAPNFICATLAWIGARYVYRIGLDLREARKMGSYRLVRRLGRGGMGEVWVAEHHMLARPAALKLVRTELMRGAGDTAAILRRFEQEAQSTAQLTSPHTVNLYDFGVTEDGVFYYVMELLEGCDLDVLVRRCGPVPASRAVHLLRQMCDSLAEAHERDLVHRDIKPSNVYASRQGTMLDFVKVLDFGIVRRRSDADGDGVRRRGVEGTPAFMAPEAAADGTASPQTDLYAVGCVGYWLLTGEFVFPADSPSDAIRKHARETPQAPSRRSPHPVPEAFDALILDCLAKDPLRRPASATTLAARLAEIEAGPWTAEDAALWWADHGETVTGASVTSTAYGRSRERS